MNRESDKERETVGLCSRSGGPSSSPTIQPDDQRSGTSSTPISSAAYVRGIEEEGVVVEAEGCAS